MYIFTQAILAVKVCPKLRRAQFDCELALPNRGGIKVGKGCSELRSLTEQPVYLRLTTIVLVYNRTQSDLLSISCYTVLPGPSLS
jgi:hypothetical protein